MRPSTPFASVSRLLLCALLASPVGCSDEPADGAQDAAADVEDARSGDPEPDPAGDAQTGTDGDAQSDPRSGGDTPDAAVDEDAPDAPEDGATADAVDADAEPPIVEPRPGTDESRARAFRLFYRERVDRALVAYNRFGIFGDTGWALAIDRADVAREGNAYDVVVGPKDNNLMGTPLRSVWHAWRNLGSDNAELTLLRMLRGLLFFEQVTGHPGLTSRMAMPGWTLEIDGVTGEAARIRAGEELESPLPTDPELEAAIIEAFFDDITVRYRLDPLDTMLTYYPGRDPADYAITVSMPDLPDFIRISDCCATLFRTPEGNRWTDAWWTNHNSRDNYPDIALGLLAALEIEASDDASDAVRNAAAEVTAAGLRIADLIEDSGGNVMTVDEFNPYDTLVISGLIRPHGLVESEGLGGMASCPMALLNRAISSRGLEAAPEDLWLPGSLETLITPEIEVLIECPFEEPRRCVSIEDAWCGLTWGTMGDLQILGQPWLELARTMEAADPGSSEGLIGAFQNDYDDVVESMVALIAVLDLQGERRLAARARVTLRHMTNLMREFADIIYGVTNPARAAEQRYEAAVFDALAGLEPIADDLDDLALEEVRMARIEGSLDIAAAEPWRLHTDEELRQIVTDGLAGLQDRSGPGRSDAIRARYADTYPDGDPPIRRAGDAYEARQGDGPWVAAERPRHRGVGNLDFLQSIVLCTTAPDVLDCSWARLGCAKPDLDESGIVDASDIALFEAALGEHGDGAACDDGCGGADLDESGALDASDRAFLDAAMGCVR